METLITGNISPGEAGGVCVLAMQLGGDRLPDSPPFSQKQPFQEATWRLTEEDTRNRNPAEGSTIQHSHPAEAQGKGQDQDKNGKEGQKDKSRVMMHLQFFGIIQELALLLEPSSFWLEFSFSCFMISIGWLLGFCSFEAEKEAGEQPALLSHLLGGRSACVNTLPSTKSVPLASATRHTR